MLSSKYLLALFAAAAPMMSFAAPASEQLSLAAVSLRIEGATGTIYEGPIVTKGHNVTTVSGGTHHCDGTNLGANPSPGPTCTSAIDDAAKLAKFPWDATFFTDFDDFFITSVGDSPQTSSQFWGILLGYQFTPVGGCQQRVKNGDEVLFAFDAFSKSHFLKLTGSTVATVGKPVTLTVTDGSTGEAISGATVGGGTSDAQGKVTLTFNKAGVQLLKAERADSIRSNAVIVAVAP